MALFGINLSINFLPKRDVVVEDPLHEQPRGLREGLPPLKVTKERPLSAREARRLIDLAAQESLAAGAREKMRGSR